MNEKQFKRKAIIAAIIVYFTIALGAYSFFERSSPPAPTNLTVEIDDRPRSYFWFAGYSTYLGSQLYDDLTQIYVIQNPEKSFEYCQCLAVTAINQLHKQHTKYTISIYKHNPITINKGLKMLAELEED